MSIEVLLNGTHPCNTFFELTSGLGASNGEQAARINEWAYYLHHTVPNAWGRNMTNDLS